MKTFTAIVERDCQTNLYVGYVPSFPGAPRLPKEKPWTSCRFNLREVIEMLLEFNISLTMKEMLE